MMGRPIIFIYLGIRPAPQMIFIMEEASIVIYRGIRSTPHINSTIGGAIINMYRGAVLAAFRRNKHNLQLRLLLLQTLTLPTLLRFDNSVLD